MISKIDNIIHELKSLPLFETIELIKEIERIFDIDTKITNFPKGFFGEVIKSQETPIIEISKKEEKTDFEVILTEVPSEKKISILKVVRSITGLGLKESKDIVDNVPKVIKGGISKDEADSLKKELENVGAVVTLN